MPERYTCVSLYLLIGSKCYIYHLLYFLETGSGQLPHCLILNHSYKHTFMNLFTIIFSFIAVLKSNMSTCQHCWFTTILT